MKNIVLENVHKHLGNREVLRDVSFTVEKGDIFGFLGPNGAGKTTTIRILLGLLPPSQGIVRVLGQEVDLPETRQHLGFLLEVDGLYDNMTAYHNLDYYARIYGLSHPEAVISTNLQIVKLADRANDKVGTFSKGMRQRLAFAKALLPDPEILILDEPTSGLDPSGQMEMRQLILDKAHREGKTVFLSSHNLDEVQRICNRIALIDKGEIKLYGEREKLQRQAGNGQVIIETVGLIPEDVLGQLREFPKLKVDSYDGSSLMLSLSGGTRVTDVIGLLTVHGVNIEQVKHAEASLENLYTRILKGVEKS